VARATPLWGRSVLIVDDEPLIVLGISEALSRAGASVIAARTVKDALGLSGSAEVSAAILDNPCGAQDSVHVQQGNADPELPARYLGAPTVTRPADSSRVVATVSILLTGGHETSSLQLPRAS
jgi:DNA-binding NarL/FixJ family response regulator